MIRLSLGVAALALGSLAFTASGDAPAPEAAEAKPTHTLTVTYQQNRGAFRRATLKIDPMDGEARPLWQGRLSHISVLTKTRGWIIIQSLRERDGSVEARSALPAPEAIAAVILHPREGTPLGWKVEEGESYTEVEWTYFDQRGQRTDPPRAQDGDGDDDDCGPIPAGCEVYNPWTCECDIGLKDPWEVRSGEGLFMLHI